MPSDETEVAEQAVEQDTDEAPVDETEATEVEIYVAEDLRNPLKNSPQHVGSVPQEYMEEEGRLILRPLTDVDRQIVSVFDDGYRFSEFWANRPHRGVYILGDDRNNISAGETPFIDDVPDLQRFYLKTDGLLHIDLNNLTQSNKDDAEKTMKPRLLFKVLRGSRAIVYKDGTGRFASTGDIVNATVDTQNTNHSLSTLFVTLNSPIVSYYLQRIVYSGSTETARNLDAPYLQNIPLPEIDTSQGEVLEHLADYLLFVHQYTYDMNIGKRAKSISTFYSQIADALIADLYFEFDSGSLWDEVAGSFNDIEYEDWADERFSTEAYPKTKAENLWDEISETYDTLDTDVVEDGVADIETDDRVERVEEVLNQ